MRFVVVNTLVDEVMAKYPKTNHINVIFSSKDVHEDKYGKITVKPVLLILDVQDEKKRLDHSAIAELFGDNIGVSSLSKCVIDKDGVACCSISTESRYSEKFDNSYHPRSYLMPGPKLIREARVEIARRKEVMKPEVFDIWDYPKAMLKGHRLGPVLSILT